MKILYITASVAYKTNAVYDYDSAFSQFSSNDIRYFDISLQSFDFDISGFDAIILSYSFFALTEVFSKSFQKKIGDFKGIKVAIFQDDYIYFLKHRKNIKPLNISGIITIVPEKYWNEVFCPDFAHIPKMQLLAGYVPEHLKNKFAARSPIASRKWHVGYRTRVYRPIFGKLCQEKIEIGQHMKKFCQERHIPANIEVVEEKRIYGKAWPQFIRDCRVLLGSESGCNVFDFDGKIARAIAAYQSAHPAAGFWEIHASCIGQADGKIRTNQISPRIFEAASLGTGHILYEGEYSGILEPWRHYIPLKKDYSNLEEVFAALADTAFLEKMISNAYEDLVASDAYSFRTCVKQIDAFLTSLGCGHQSGASQLPPSLAKNAPLPFSALDLNALQARETARARKLADKYAGRNILIYGAGAAFREYAELFARANILGIVLDDGFLDKTAAKTPFINFARARELAPEAAGCVIFCRPDFSFSMYEKIADILPEDKKPECCLLFA